MVRFKTSKRDVSYKQKRVVRVIIYFNNGSITTGTGFFVRGDGTLLTCCHIVAGGDLKNIKMQQDFQNIRNLSGHGKYAKYIKNKVSKILIELPNGKKLKANLKGFDHYYDLAVLKIVKTTTGFNHFVLEHTNSLDFSDEIIFCGFPECLGYSNMSSPFAVNTGIVSTFPEVEIAGKKYENIQLNTISLWGNSGAPLLKAGDDKVWGIVNGLYWHSRDNFAFYDPNGNLSKGGFRVPLSISYATSFNLLKNKSKLFRNLLNNKI